MGKTVKPHELTFERFSAINRERPDELDFQTFLEDVVFEHLRMADLRYGQVLYNHLAEVRKDLADGIVGTELDPFYFDDRVNLCCQWLQENWNVEEPQARMDQPQGEVEGLEGEAEGTQGRDQS